MKNLSIAVSLRILILITFSLNIFSIFYFDSSHSLTEPQTYISISFWFVLFLIYIQQYRYKKSRPDGRIVLREMILPEFNAKDEREAELTGRAAKSALATVIVFSFFLMAIISFTFTFEVNFYLITYLSIISVPISGLIAYYFSYRYYYLK